MGCSHIHCFYVHTYNLYLDSSDLKNLGHIFKSAKGVN